VANHLWALPMPILLAVEMGVFFVVHALLHIGWNNWVKDEADILSVNVPKKTLTRDQLIRLFESVGFVKAMHPNLWEYQKFSLYIHPAGYVTLTMNSRKRDIVNSLTVEPVDRSKTKAKKIVFTANRKSTRDHLMMSATTQGNPIVGAEIRHREDQPQLVVFVDTEIGLDLIKNAQYEGFKRAKKINVAQIEFRENNPILVLPAPRPTVAPAPVVPAPAFEPQINLRRSASALQPLSGSNPNNIFINKNWLDRKNQLSILTDGQKNLLTHSYDDDQAKRVNTSTELQQIPGSNKFLISPAVYEEIVSDRADFLMILKNEYGIQLFPTPLLDTVRKLGFAYNTASGAWMKDTYKINIYPNGWELTENNPTTAQSPRNTIFTARWVKDQKFTLHNVILAKGHSTMITAEAPAEQDPLVDLVSISNDNAGLRLILDQNVLIAAAATREINRDGEIKSFNNLISIPEMSDWEWIRGNTQIVGFPKIDFAGLEPSAILHTYLTPDGKQLILVVQE
jgi:hypothetical protein